jgi:cobalt-zinc-cadmium resistance protein CzcA
MAPGPSQVSRERLQRRITVELNVRGRDIGSFVEEAKAALDRDVKLPVGYYTTWAGEYERLQSAAKQLAVVIPIALALILVLLVMTFGRMRPALLIFVNVPMAISGGIGALALRGLPLSVSAAIGFIALFGVAVLNGLVLVTSIERLRDAGASAADAVLRGAGERLRPVLTTALVASLGFLPMALATGAGAEVQRPLATVVIGGLFSSTLLTLLVIPTIYAWLVRRDRKSEAPVSVLKPEA